MRFAAPLFLSALASSSSVQAAENVRVPAFRSVELSGGGNVVIVPGPAQRVTILEGSTRFSRFQVARRGELKIDACNGSCPPRYHLRIEIQSPQVPHLDVSGGGDIIVQGGFRPQSDLAAAVNGGGRINARAIDIGDVTAAVHGGGNISVNARSRLTAAVNGGGTIRYSGNPRVTSVINGGGSVARGN